MEIAPYWHSCPLYTRYRQIATDFSLPEELGFIVQPMPSPLGRVARRAGRGAELASFLLAFRRKPTVYTPLPSSNSPVYGRIRSHLPQRGRHCACGAKQNAKLKFEPQLRTGHAQWCGTSTAAKTRMVSGNLPRKIRYFFPAKDGKSFTKRAITGRMVANATERKEDSL